MNKILLVGVARSGTTWAATILSKCKDTMFLNEPDDERRFKAAAQYKAGLTRYPMIAPGDDVKVGESDVAQYTYLWYKVWRKDPQVENLLVKSVFVPFCLEWLKEKFEIDHVVWVKRNLYDTIKSWQEYSSRLNPSVDRDVLLRRLAWQACSHYAAYQRLHDNNFFSMSVDHAELVRSPEVWYKELAEAVGLEMGHEAWEQMSDLNAAGVGGHYGLPGYSLEDHVKRTQKQALESASWDKDELAIINEEVAKWLPKL